MTGPQFLSPLLASGGDRRIAVPAGGNVNLYGASPFPRATLGYASSTANDISREAFARLEGILAAWQPGEAQDAGCYALALDGLRARLRSVWSLDDATAVVFAPSGTDLEFAALAIAAGRAGRPVTNILLGADEVGSGCLLASAGRHFASEGAVRPVLAKGAAVAGLDATERADLPVRDAGGAPLAPAAVAQAVAAVAQRAIAAGRHVLVHVVHGSKTGLVLPGLAEIDALRARYGADLTFVVDACQVRLDGCAIRAYLERDCMVLLTGSKFVGGPPFSGFALVPRGLPMPAKLAPGLADLFRRGEWPVECPAAAMLPAQANPGLLLRLEAAVFELERFALIAVGDRDRVIAAFATAVRALSGRLGSRLVSPSLDGPGLHVSTLATLDLSGLPGAPCFATAQRWHRVLSARGLRLGQPVKCVEGAAGQWAGTLRISLSMPLIGELSQLQPAALAARLASDMSRIADVIEAAQRPVVA